MMTVKMLLMSFGLFLFALVASAHQAEVGGAIAQAEKSSMVIRGGYVIDVTADRKPYRANLVIHDGVIEQILASDKALPADAEILDVTGKYIIPGLIDAHVHIDSAKAQDREGRNNYFETLLRQNLRGGVTSVRDMGGDGRLLAELRRASVLHEIPSPEIFFSGQMAGPVYHQEAADRLKSTFKGWPQDSSPWQMKVEPTTDLVRAIAEVKGLGATGVKLYAALDYETTAAIIAEAKRQGLRAWGHATLMPARHCEAVRAGMEVLSHAEMLRWEVAGALSASMFENWDKYYDQIQGAAPRLVELFEQMASKGAILDATAYHASQNGMGDQVVVLLKMARQYGVRVAAGTDYVSYDDRYFPYLHEEIRFLVNSAGFSPREALASATLISAAAIGVDNERGSIEEGKRADLLVLDKNPLESIDHIESIYTVIKDGRVYQDLN